MAVQGQQQNDPCQPRPSRTTSCQLPAQHPQSGRSFHRSSQSCSCNSSDPEAAKSAEAGPCIPRPQCSRSDYQGGKMEKQRFLSAGQASVTLLSIFATLIPVAFVAGYGTAMVGGRCRSQSLAHEMAVGFTGDYISGDQAIPVLNDRLASQDILVSESRKLVSTESQALALPSYRAEERSTMSLPGSNILFVTWIAFGEFGDGGFHTHNFHSVDMRWAEVAKKSHPGCKIGLVLDQDTELEHPEMVDFLHRFTIDKKVYGRNEYNDFYHWQARLAMLEKLQAEGQGHLNLVFLDPDVFVLDDIQEVFDQGGFDYATTISENPIQPINGAMHFVRGHRYGGAIEILKGVLASFQLKPEMGFTAGQQAYSDFFELTLRDDLVKELQDTSVSEGMACNKIKEGDFQICYVICARYNFWEDCSDNPAMQVEAENPADYAAVHVKVFHFIAYRKLGMTEVYEAFMANGLEGAYAAWAGLPHTEDGFKADPRFGEEA